LPGRRIGNCEIAVKEQAMPSYDYLCQQCKKEFEVRMTIAELEQKKQVACPACNSSDVVRQITGFQVQTSKKS